MLETLSRARYLWSSPGTGHSSLEYAVADDSSKFDWLSYDVFLRMLVFSMDNDLDVSGPRAPSLAPY